LINNLKLIDSIDLDEFKTNIKEARESKKVTIQQASKTLHIEKDIIEKLEDGNFDQISIDIFILGHIRSYLIWIGIDHKLLINDNKPENINLNQKNDKITLPYSFKISKFYISLIAFALFIIILIIYININVLETEKETTNKNIENYEALINKEKNNNETEEISKVINDSSETYNFEENNMKSKEIAQSLNDEEKIILEEVIQNLKEEKIVEFEEIIKSLNEEEKVEYANINESKIMKGDTIIGLLKNVKWSIKEAIDAADVFSTIYDPKKINAGMVIIFPKDISIKVFAIAINKKTAVVIKKIQNQSFVVKKQSLDEAREIISSSNNN
jgi:cytoskeletal protein RodZ